MEVPRSARTGSRSTAQPSPGVQPSRVQTDRPSPSAPIPRPSLSPAIPRRDWVPDGGPSRKRSVWEVLDHIEIDAQPIIRDDVLEGLADASPDPDTSIGQYDAGRTIVVARLPAETTVQRGETLTGCG